MTFNLMKEPDNS